MNEHDDLLLDGVIFNWDEGMGKHSKGNGMNDNGMCSRGKGTIRNKQWVNGAGFYRIKRVQRRKTYNQSYLDYSNGTGLDKGISYYSELTWTRNIAPTGMKNRDCRKLNKKMSVTKATWGVSSLPASR